MMVFVRESPYSVDMFHVEHMKEWDNMTKKDYELIAKALRVEMEKMDIRFQRSSPNHVHSLTDQELSAMRRASVASAIMRVCDALEEDNPRFNADIFRRACGIDEV